MKKSVLVLLVVVIVLAAASSIAWAKGGSAKGDDVCWMMNGKEHRAIFYETGSGIVHEWRHEPHDAHLIFKPQSEFPKEPQGPHWWGWKGRAYFTCSSYTPGDPRVEDFLPVGELYWVFWLGHEDQ